MASAASIATLRPGSSAHAIPVGVAGQQDVGYAIVATGRGVLRLPPSAPINLYLLCTINNGLLSNHFTIEVYFPNGHLQTTKLSRSLSIFRTRETVFWYNFIIS
ncbi:hypothetical protein [Virgibacillus halodenitrificans]|uniref:WIAG-tail domain n=1 Tax=Virgibacillus halodenitrificans TaxID=1482 RepID=A0ABR7VLS3_VIRHA|nr:hypothetical protein [Virgibacillus halodenitrificans]MBD1222856.1 hypothetical protein [Virgibacillus halodenitrificans]